VSLSSRSIELGGRKLGLQPHCRFGRALLSPPATGGMEKKRERRGGMNNQIDRFCFDHANC
jgi:hypothetical protein